MRALPIVHHPLYTADTPEGHRFPMGKFQRLADVLIQDGLAPHGFIQPEPAGPDILGAAHTPAYVTGVLDRSLPRHEVRRIGFELTPRVVLRAQLATGGTLLAARIALEQGLACNSAGGSHHAQADFGAGFCVFNDVAVALSSLLREGAIRKALIIDLDVHHGDGNAAIFKGRPDVFTFSVHCKDNWPLVKPASDLDIGLEKGAGDEAMLSVLDQHLDPLLDQTQPDLVAYIAGVDPHKDDRLGLLTMSDAGLMARERTVVHAVRGRGIPLVTVLGGGYSSDLDALASRHALIFHACADWLSAS
jgi:acetoin utilization deacetylase AcuC-like enzyme